MTRPITGGGQAYFIDPMRMPTPAPSVAPILPNRYCVIGPDEITPIGEKTSPDPPGNHPNTRRIVLKPNGHRPTRRARSKSTITSKTARTNPQQYHERRRTSRRHPAAAGHYCRQAAPTKHFGADGHRWRRLLSATERPHHQRLTLRARDTPLDYNRPGDYPNAIKRDATTQGFGLIHLQRLADPLNAWDANNNPYLTVDSAVVDLTAFNGETDSTPGPGATEAGFSKVPLKFGSREHGPKPAKRPVPAPNAVINPNPWQQKFDNSVSTRTIAGPDVTLVDNTHVFGYKLVHTLGYLNEVLGDHWKGTLPAQQAPVMVSGGATPAYPNVTANDYTSYVGDPKTPFPWFTFNNRPYASTMELALVPAVRSSKLLDSTRFSTHDGSNPYNPAAGRTGPFDHLLNPFDSAGTRRRRTCIACWSTCRCRRSLSARKPGSTPRSSPAARTTASTPPSIRCRNFRDPGRINLNTIFDVEGRTWGGIMDTQNPVTGPWNKVAISRQGYAGNVYQLNPSFPTIFAKPFRSYGGNTLVPLGNMRDPNNPTGFGQEIDSTLLRGTAPLDDAIIRGRRGAPPTTTPIATRISATRT